MISLIILNKEFAKDNGLNLIYKINHLKDLTKLGFNLTVNSDFIFQYENGETHYYKDRSGSLKQFTEEEISIMVLKSLPL